jgi:hypothetical protein
MTRKNRRLTSGLLPHQIVALGAQESDDEKVFRAANATYRAIRALEFALSLQWMGTLKSPSREAEEDIRPRSISLKQPLKAFEFR